MTLALYRRELDAISRNTLGLLLPLFSSTSAKPDQAFQDTVWRIVTNQRLLAYQAALDMLREEAAKQNIPDPYLPEPTPYPRQAVATVFEENKNGSPADLAATFIRHVEASARTTTVRAVNDTATELRRPRAWARVLTGADNCPFCVMLASRGPIYGSAESAGRIPASFKWVDAQGFVNSYHDNCDCLVVPVFGKNWSGSEQSSALYKLWRDATKGFSGSDALNALSRELARMNRENEPLHVENLRAA